MAWIDYAGEHGAAFQVFARTYHLSSWARSPPQVISLEESELHDVCRDTHYAPDFDRTPPDRSDDSYVTLLAALLLALAFAGARLTPPVALEGERDRSACTRCRGDAAPLPRARLVVPRR